METSSFTIDPTWDDLPLECVVEFLYPVETLILALTCTISRAAVKAVHRGKVPPMKTKYMLDLVKDGRLEIIKWVRAQKPPCPCEFSDCRQLAKDCGVLNVWAYLTPTTDRENMWSPTVPMAELKALLGQICHGIHVNVKASDGWPPLHLACEADHAELAKEGYYRGDRSGPSSCPPGRLGMSGQSSGPSGRSGGGAGSEGSSGMSSSLQVAPSTKLATKLRNKGADLYAKDNRRRTPLHRVCKKDLQRRPWH